MATEKHQEPWLRGPLPGIPCLLQPVAHALTGAKEEVDALMIDFPDELLWEKPAGVASPGFHLQHLKGVLDRLFTYARGETLSQTQLENLHAEGDSSKTTDSTQQLVAAFNEQVEKAIEQLKATDEKTLTDERFVGRQKLPSTILGLLFHAAEHSMRHTGQLIVTVKVLRTRTN